MEQQLAQVETARGAIRIADELDHIALHCAGLPRLDRRSAEEIIGYGEYGLPA